MKAIYLIFELSMPNVGSWNGKWTGEKNYHARTMNFTARYGKSATSEAKLKEILKEGSYYYNFGDGWGADVSVKSADSKEAAKAKKKSVGFCGYEWMIDSIMQYNKILNTAQSAALANG